MFASHCHVSVVKSFHCLRWLPTAMCAAENKLLINAALGFDSYLVMRHGHGVAAEGDVSAAEDERRLGCYFCNDIIAATNSTRDRTLDQQCTVTRPGLSFIAAALSVEMMVAVQHSRHGIRHPAPTHTALSASSDSNQDDIGAVKEVVIPHQIRGSLTGFTQFLPQVTLLLVVVLTHSDVMIDRLQRSPIALHVQLLLLMNIVAVVCSLCARHVKTVRCWRG